MPDSTAQHAAAKQPTVLVGVTGCIAAYKSCEIVRGLQKAGVRVKVVMTEHATEFVGPTTFRALTHEPVAVGLFDDPSDPIHHISLAQEADVFVIAPCTANVMAKIANGIADDLLTTTALATTSPLMIAPAMNVHMYENAATMANRGKLEMRGVEFIEAGEGYLACGDVGRGRLADPSDIVTAVLARLGIAHDLAGLRVLVTAGPTVEPIDPVRFLTNSSSGKMGYAVAEAAARRGADVTLVSGPVTLQPPAGVHTVRVRTARDMLQACEEAFQDTDIVVCAAAVADMRPEVAAASKLKKATDAEALSTIHLVENPDILATLGAAKGRRTVVGFAAETDDVVANGRAKLEKKHADLIVANEVGYRKTFGEDTNTAVLIMPDEEVALPTMSKRDVAERILDQALALHERK